MANVLTQFTITEVIPGYWRVTFSNPPINLTGSPDLTCLGEGRRGRLSRPWR
jgi:hypothetical protein